MPSIRETAGKIAERHHPSRSLTQNAELVSAIEQALRNERERCAKIADDEANGLTAQAKEYDKVGQDRWAEDCRRSAPVCRDIAAAIRKED